MERKSQKNQRPKRENATVSGEQNLAEFTKLNFLNF